ncbi:MAG: hypothetical protein GTO41_22960 [Burkholderiales bacterium]|nr:hypothetical protein [Burkholderiales bacterium]
MTQARSQILREAVRDRLSALVETLPDDHAVYTFARSCGFLDASELHAFLRGSFRPAWRLVALSRKALIKRGRWGARDDKACGWYRFLQR